MSLPSAGVQPSVTVVVPTHNRPDLMRRAVASVVAQEYDGELEVIVVFDRSEADPTVVRDVGARRVRVLVNGRTPGLAGARNTGILGCQTDFVAFCDDDDTWEPGKLRAQMEAVRRHPGTVFVTTAMTVDYEGKESVRRAGTDRVEYRDLLRSRMAMLHSSSFVIDRKALTGPIGLVDETLPKSMAEDWELLLRAARHRAITHVDDPLIRVQWGSSSYFAEQWQDRNDARLWLLSHYPDMVGDRVGAGLTYGKLAFGCAALGRRREAVEWAVRAVRAHPAEPRAYLALLVAGRLVRWQWIVRQLNRRGHGI